jgi:hypothetical protein
MASVWFNRFLKTWASLGVKTDPSDAQANAGFAFLGAAPPTVELFNALEQYSDQKDTYLYNQIASVINWGGKTPVETDPNTLRDSIIGKQRQVLTASVNYYIDISGNDTTGDGTIGKPWKTLQFAYTWILNKIDPAGWVVNLQLKSPGTYGPLVMNVPINGTMFVTGDKLNPRNYIVKNTNGTGIYVTQSSVAYIQGLSLEAAGVDIQYNPIGVGLVADRSAVAIIDSVAFGPCSAGQIWAAESGVVYPANGTSSSNIIYGNSKNFIACFNAGTVQLRGTTITFQGVPTYSSSFLVSTNAGIVDFGTTIFSGSCIGTKYVVATNGVLLTVDGGASIPGTVDGVVSSGGQVT